MRAQMSRLSQRLFPVCVALALTLLTSTAATAATTTERVSVSSAEEQGDNDSFQPALSADGRYVAFVSNASNLVPGDTNGARDVFVRDRVDGTTERVSVNSAEEQANSWSDSPALSADGRFVAFQSPASNLVSGDPNGDTDIFVRDRQDGTTERVSLSSTEEWGNQPSYYPALSADGRYVAFQSYASNLVPGDTNGENDVFVRDRVDGTTERVSVNSAGEQADNSSYYPALSADGRYVAFESWASNLIPAATNGYRHIFVRDRVDGVTERVSVNSAEEEADNSSYQPAISADGRYVVFESNASNLAPGDTNGENDVFVRDRVDGTTERVSVNSAEEQADNWSYSPTLSADGRYVVFESEASNLVPGDTNGDTDVFVRDRTTTITERVSESSTGEQANSGSAYATLSADGHCVAFNSGASNLVTGDTNSYHDVFVRILAPPSHSLSVTASADPGTIPSAGTTELKATAEDSHGHDITSWSWSDNGAGGTFSLSADVQNPTWTGPGVASGALVERKLTVCATCTEGLQQCATTVVWEGEGEPHTLTVTASAEPTTIASGGQVGLSASASDSLAHGIASWEWSDGAAGGTFSPSTLTPNPTWTAPGNDTGSPVTHTLSVTAICDGYTPVSAGDTVEVVENPGDPGDPDLAVTNLVVTTPPDPTSGELPQFSVTVMNSGLSAVGSFTVDVYPDMIAPPGSGMRGEGKIQFDGLAGGASETRSSSFVVGGGLRNAWAVVDAGGNIGETDETNNQYGPVDYELSAVPLVATAFWDFGLTGVAGLSLDLLSLKFASVGGSALEIGAQATAGKGLRYELVRPWDSARDELHVIRSTRVGVGFTADIGSLNLGVIDADAAAAEVGMRQMMALDYRFDDPWTNDDQAAVITVLSLADMAELGAYEAPIVGPIIAGIIEWETQQYASGYREKLSCSVEGYGRLGAGEATVKVGPLDATPITGELGASVEGAAKVYSEVNLDPTADVAGEQGLMIGATGKVGLLFNPSVSGTYTVGFGEQIGWDGNRDSYVCSGERQLTSTTNIAEERHFWSDRLEIPDATVTAMGDRLAGTVVDTLASGQPLPVGPELLASAVTTVTDKLRDYSLDLGNEPVAEWERCERTAYGYRIPLNIDIGAALGFGGSLKLGIEGTALTGVEAVTARGEFRNGEPHTWALYTTASPRYEGWEGFQDMMLDIMPRGIARAAEHIQEFIGSAWENVLAGTTSVVDAAADAAEGLTQVVADATGFGEDVWVGIESYWADVTAGIFGAQASAQRLSVPYSCRLARSLRATELPVDQEILIVGRVHCVSVTDDEGAAIPPPFPPDAIQFEATVLPSQMLKAGMSGAEMTGLRLFRYRGEEISWDETPSCLTAKSDGSYLIEASLTKPGEYAAGIIRTPFTGPEPAVVNVWPGQMEICSEIVLGVGAIFRDENGMDDYTASVLVDRDPVGSLATDLSPLGVYLSVQGDVALEPGSHRLEVTASDLAGGEASARTTFFVVRENTFLDVPTTLWAWQQVEAVKLAGVVQGYSDGRYQPGTTVTRDQMAVYIARALAGGDGNVPAADAYPDPSFEDVAADYWAYRYIEYAVGAEVVAGYDDRTYRPEDGVDRGQMAAYVARAKGWVGIDDDMTTAPELFPDVPAGFWAGTAVQVCVENDVVRGYDDGYYRPDDLVTRDQMAVYIARAFELTL